MSQSMIPMSNPVMITSDAIPVLSNMNDAPKGYFSILKWNGSTTNRPVNADGLAFTYWVGNYGTQIALTRANENLRIRTVVNDTWGSWKQVPAT